MNRPSWDETFSEIARTWSRRSTCSRRKVGAVLVKDKKVIGNGYNGAPTGLPHCTDGGCPRGQLSYADVPADSDYNQFPCVAIHAEHNAILQAGAANARGAVLYCTAPPCGQCTALIRQVEIAGVILVSDKRDEIVETGSALADANSEASRVIQYYQHQLREAQDRNLANETSHDCE